MTGYARYNQQCEPTEATKAPDAYSEAVPAGRPTATTTNYFEQHSLLIECSD
jgi:hypothetical protein